MKTDIGTNNKTNLKTGVKTYNLDELKQLFTNNRIIGPSGRLNCQREKYLTGNKDVYNIYIMNIFRISVQNKRHFIVLNII